LRRQYSKTKARRLHLSHSDDRQRAFRVGISVSQDAFARALRSGYRYSSAE
jgi:hypothetical protein